MNLCFIEYQPQNVLAAFRRGEFDGLGTFADEIKSCVEIPLGRQRLKVLSLERILASKLAANRPKDKLTIPVLRDALAATQSVKRRAKRK